MGLAELPGSPQHPQLLLCDTSLMACLSFPLLKNRGQSWWGRRNGGGGGHQSCVQLRVKCSANLSYQSGGNSENIPEAAGIHSYHLYQKATNRALLKETGMSRTPLFDDDALRLVPATTLTDTTV